MDNENTTPTEEKDKKPEAEKPAEKAEEPKAETAAETPSEATAEQTEETAPESTEEAVTAESTVTLMVVYRLAIAVPTFDNVELMLPLILVLPPLPVAVLVNLTEPELL